MGAAEQFTLQSPTNRTDLNTFLRMKFTRTKYWAEIPINRIIDWSITQSENAFFWRGHFSFYDPAGMLSENFNFTGTEDVEIEYGGNEDNRSFAKGTVYSAANTSKTNKAVVVTLWFTHPGAKTGNKAKPFSFDGLLSDAVGKLFTEMCVECGNRKTIPTINIGKYVNPGMKIVDFMRTMQQFAVSPEGLGDYLSYTTFDGAVFAPINYFNTLPVIQGFDNVFKRDYKSMIFESNFKPFDSASDVMGMAKRVGAGFDYENSTSILKEVVAEDIINAKTFVGKYTTIQKEMSDAANSIQYTRRH
jgi:hypothetical protein